MSRRRTFSLCCTLGLCLVVLAALLALEEGRARAGGGTHYVAPGADCAGEKPCYASIQAAVDSAADGDRILVAAGVYTDVHRRPVPPGYPNPPATGVITQVVYITKPVTLQGGYTPDFAGAPDRERNPTWLDAGGRGRVLVAGGGITTMVDSLGITGGDALGLGGGWWEPPDVSGGGAYFVEATVTISACDVVGNRAVDGSEMRSAGGGGMSFVESNAALRGNRIADNVAAGSMMGGGAVGGGLLFVGGDALLSGNTISGNGAAGNGASGGAVRFLGKNLTLSGNEVSDNWIAADFQAGAGLDVTAEQATIISNTISNNRAYGLLSFGDGLYLESGDALLRSNAIISNTGFLGAGLALVDSRASLANNVVANNGYGGLHVQRTSARLDHTTIANNGTDASIGIKIDWAGSYLTMTNTILLGHAEGIRAAAGNTATMEATLWGSGIWANRVDRAGAGTVITGSANYRGNPFFVDWQAGDYHIRRCSAARNRGVDAGIGNDMDGDARPAGGEYDIGADEYVGGWQCARFYLPLALGQ